VRGHEKSRNYRAEQDSEDEDEKSSAEQMPSDLDK
jgi:hypothetical protein